MLKADNTAMIDDYEETLSGDEEEEEFDDTSFFRVIDIGHCRIDLILRILCSQDEAGLCNDLGFLAHLPELCDITFMVGREKEPVCAVRAVLGNPSSCNPTTLIPCILAARSPKFLEKLYLEDKR